MSGFDLPRFWLDLSAWFASLPSSVDSILWGLLFAVVLVGTGCLPGVVLGERVQWGFASLGGQGYRSPQFSLAAK